MQSILESLSLLGLDVFEILVFTKIFKLKKIDISSIASELGIKETKCVSITNSLYEKGFVVKRGDSFFPIDEKLLNRKIEDRVNRLKTINKEFPRLKALLNEITSEYDHVGKLNIRLNKIRENISGKGGRIQNCEVLLGDNIKSFFGASYNNIVCVPKKLDSWLSNANPKDIITFGGVCTLRTFENRVLSLQGKLVDITTGKLFRPSDINQLTSWIENNVSLDQIASAILPNIGNNYILYTEEALWSEKIINYYEKINGVKLPEGDKNKVFKACVVSEKKKFELTKKYLEFITKRKLNIRHLSDIEIRDILVEARDEVLKENRFTLDDIVKEVVSQNSYKNILNMQDIIKYISDYSLVWTLFTGTFWKIMYRKKIIEKEKILITSPWDLAYPSLPDGKSYFNDRVFSSVNEYLNGYNKNVAFVATQMPSNFNHRPYVLNNPIDEIPNVLNWREKLKILENTEPTASLRDNPIYITSVNYLSYSTVGGL